jgi:hypothetical protein
MTSSEIYLPVSDKIYTEGYKQIAVDADTKFKSSIRVNAQSNGYATALGAGLNDTSSTTTIGITNASNSRLRWDNTYIAITAGFYGTNTTTACSVAPSWNCIPAQIDTISLQINGSNTDIYSSPQNNFMHEYASRLLTTYDADTLNNLNEQIFAPIWHVGDEVASTTIGTQTTYGHSYSCNLRTTLTNAQKARIYNNQTNVLNRYITKYISLKDLFGINCGVSNNIRSIFITIKWANNGSACMENYNSTTGSMSIMRCEAFVDSYTCTGGRQTENVNEKQQFTIEKIPYLHTYTYPKTYMTGSDIIVNNIKNLQQVCVIDPVRVVNLVGFENGAGTTGGIDNSIGQFMMMNQDSNAGSNTVIQWADEGGSANYSWLNQCQLLYGSLVYPQMALNSIDKQPTGSNTVDFSGYYQEYCKALNASSAKTAHPMPYNIFRSILPFIMLRPWSNNCSHLTQEGRDLILKLNNANVPTTFNPQMIFVVTFCLKVLEISPDGSVSISQ